MEPQAANQIRWVAHSAVGKQLLTEARAAAVNSDYPVLVTGEIGVGKSYLARFIHGESRRSIHPLVFVDCGSFGDLDNVLYGHYVGSFTGASRNQPGRLSEANLGTVVLDDVERLSHHQQDQLHRVLVDGTYYPLGARRPATVDVRFVATTNKDPEREVQDGHLKPDFVSRLDYFRLHVPPLRERQEDIPAICRELLRRCLHGPQTLGCQSEDVQFHEDSWVLIRSHKLPDNVRSLEKLIVRIVAHLGDRTLITPEDVYRALESGSNTGTSSPSKTLRAVVEAVERTHILDVCQQTGFNLRRASRILGITPKSLYAKLRRFGIARP